MTDQKQRNSDKSQDKNQIQSSNTPAALKLLFLSLLLLTGSGALFHYSTKSALRNPATVLSRKIKEWHALAAHHLETRQQQQAVPVSTRRTAPGSARHAPPTASTPASNVRWPPLTLSGFGRGSGNREGFAIINGEQVLVGSIVKGVTIVEILEHGVFVEYLGETKTLTVDRR